MTGLQHELDCHCGKRAKVHAEWGMDSNAKPVCGNVCGIHARSKDILNRGTVTMICDECGKHCTSGYCKSFNLLKGTSTIKCMECRS